jgi:hypothetical protein
MVAKEALLVIFVQMVDRIPQPGEPEPRRRGRPQLYPERLIVKALVIMVIRRLYSAYSLLAFLEQESELTRALRPLLREGDGYQAVALGNGVWAWCQRVCLR